MEHKILKVAYKTLEIADKIIEGVPLVLLSRPIGFSVTYGLGALVGEGMDHIPYISEFIPQAVNFVSGIDVKGNLDGLVGLLGGYMAE